MKRIFAITMALLLNSHANGLCQDVITFKTGNRVDCKVKSYENGTFAVELSSGDVKQAPVGNITSIAFGESSPDTATITPPAPDSTPEAVTLPIPSNMPEEAKAIEGQGHTQVLNKGIQLTIKKYDNKIALESGLSISFRKKGIKAVAANVLVENKSAKPIGVYWGSFKIRDQDDNVYEASLFAAGPRGYLDYTTVQPGDKIASWIAFEVSPGIVMEKSSIRYDKTPNGYSPDSMYSDWFPVSIGK